MTNEDSVVMPVSCGRDDCGMVSAYRVWRDGSFKRITDGCYHEKIIPSGEIVEDAWNEDQQKKLKKAG